MLNISLNLPAVDQEYTDRPTVKAVIIDGNGKILVFNSNLVGGGVEGDESNEEALHREILEETGISQFELSVYEAKVYNRKTARLFIEESLRS